ncbi:hypothetical protein VPH6E351B_0078 [Vibrio phage 6E35-1b]
MNMQLHMQRLAREYRNSDNNIPGMHLDIFAIPDDDGGIDHTYVQRVIDLVVDEIMKHTGWNRTEAREWFRDSDIDTWFGESFEFDYDFQHTFYFRYDLPSKLKEYQQGMKTTMEVKY